MIREHWEEVGVYRDLMPLDLDWPFYERAEDAGLFKAVGAWRGRKLIGYNAFIVGPNHHYRSTIHAISDAIYIDPDERGVGVRMIRQTERLLERMFPDRWVRIIYRAKVNVERDRGTLGRVYEALGYEALEMGYDKMVRAG